MLVLPHISIQQCAHNVTSAHRSGLDRCPLNGVPNMLRTEEARAVRLADYRPPDWLVETVHLDVKLDATRSPVRATIKFKPNPAAGAPAPLKLDGDGLTLVSLKLDGETLAADRYTATPNGLTIPQPPNRAVHAGNRDAGRSDRQHAVLRALSRIRRLLHAVRGGRLPPHHLFPGPARRHGGLHHADRGRQSRSAGAAGERQSHRAWRPAGRTPLRGLARSVAETVLSVRAGRRQARRRRGHLHHHVRPQGRAAASTSSPARRSSATSRWIRSSARCAGTSRRSAASTISTSS